MMLCSLVFMVGSLAKAVPITLLENCESELRQRTSSGNREGAVREPGHQAQAPWRERRRQPGRHLHQGPPGSPVLRWRDPHTTGEQIAEAAEAGEADLHAD